MPWAAFVPSLSVASFVYGEGFDPTADLAMAPSLRGWAAALLALPSAALLVGVRRPRLFGFGVVALTVLVAASNFAVVGSDDAQAGLFWFMLPMYGLPGAVALAVADRALGRWGRRAPISSAPAGGGHRCPPG